MTGPGGADRLMRGSLYLRRGTGRGTWRTVLALAVIGGLLGAVALGALAGARRTAGAYGRYLDASRGPGGRSPDRWGSRR
jgi:hypothetical protein